MTHFGHFGTTHNNQVPEFQNINSSPLGKKKENKIEINTNKNEDYEAKKQQKQQQQPTTTSNKATTSEESTASPKNITETQTEITTTTRSPKKHKQLIQLSIKGKKVELTHPKPRKKRHPAQLPINQTKINSYFTRGNTKSTENSASKVQEPLIGLTEPPPQGQKPRQNQDKLTQQDL